jgi:hypothetical protein
MKYVSDVRIVIALALSLVLAVGAGSAAAEPVPQHVVDAEGLVADLLISGKNAYGTAPSYIHWLGPSSEARTVGPTFITLLLQHSYGWTANRFGSWFGSASPDSVEYHGAIESQNQFTRLEDLTRVAAGDLIAIKYLDSGGNTGQVLLVAGPPVPADGGVPDPNGNFAYDVPIIDSTSTPHGKTDTRVTHPGVYGRQGIGKGMMRVYVNAAYLPTAYSWTTTPGAQAYRQTERNLVIGRLKSAGPSGLLFAP